jgi:hypothetical protein
MIALNNPLESGFSLVSETDFERDWIDRMSGKLFYAKLCKDGVTIRARGPYHNTTGLLFSPVIDSPAQAKEEE